MPPGPFYFSTRTLTARVSSYSLQYGPIYIKSTHLLKYSRMAIPAIAISLYFIVLGKMRQISGKATSIPIVTAIAMTKGKMPLKMSLKGMSGATPATT